MRSPSCAKRSAPRTRTRGTGEPTVPDEPAATRRAAAATAHDATPQRGRRLRFIGAAFTREQTGSRSVTSPPRTRGDWSYPRDAKSQTTSRQGGGRRERTLVPRDSSDRRWKGPVRLSPWITGFARLRAAIPGRFGAGSARDEKTPAVVMSKTYTN